MCGIAGSYGGGAVTEIEAALDRLAHRGPDGRGIRHQGAMTHGHVRLAVLDPTSASAQPFRRGDGVLTYNGELWNYQALRADLEAAGERFTTTGDTEVLAAALHRWGPAEALRRFDGMFAFAWSTARGTALLARDRYGKVPLYVTRQAHRFRWASERKGLPVREQRGARALPPGTWLDLTTGRLTPFGGSAPPLPATADTVLALLRRGVTQRLQADVPLCCLISGGLDSSLILALTLEQTRDVVAYTATFDAQSPDLRAARRLCAEFGVPLREVPVAAPSVAAIHEAVRAIEIASKAQLEIALLCLPLAQQMRADGFRVCLSGEAADELFGGYGSLCIKAARATDAEWTALRRAQVAKMARGNFVRCNKVFMAAGVECRLPFMEEQLVTTALAASKAACPPQKRLLKAAAAPVLPRWVISRPKETFQGGAGMSAAVAQLIHAPQRYYNATARALYGGVVME
jgi:asparagine synthase (glutamine-hydrolysing)